MGQKVNPIGFRLGVNRGWDSVWFARKNDYGKFLIEDYKIREFIKKNIQNSGVSEIIIERSGKKCSIFIHTSRPGFVIGKKGSDIEKIKKKDEPDEDPEDITPGRIGEYMGDREDEFVAEYESALKNLVENGSELEL